MKTINMSRIAVAIATGLALQSGVAFAQEQTEEGAKYQRESGT